MATQTITVEDNGSPSFTTPIDATIECNDDIDDLTLTGDIVTSTDSCDPTLPTAAYSDATDSTPCGGSAIIIRTWVITDACNNTASATQTITVEDNTDPTFTAPADVTIECDQDIDDLIITGDIVTADDSCDPNPPTANYSDVVDDVPCGGSAIVIRTWTVTDDCGNSTSATQTITVEDNGSPSFTTPIDVTIECTDDIDDLTLTGDIVTSTDSCDPTLPTAAYSDATDSTPCGGSAIIIRTWVITDACNNTASATQTIAVEDNTCLLYTSPSPRDQRGSRMPSSA